MSGRQRFTFWSAGRIALLALVLLTGCGGVNTTSTAGSAGTAMGDTYTSAQFSTSYDNALPASSQLLLGTLKLEGTANAVTAEQAKVLLPLWQALAGGGLTSETEINAVLKQIERTMTEEQLAAIAAMKLTSDDMTAWMQEQGTGFRPAAGPGQDYPNPGGSPGAGSGQGWPGGPGGPGDLSEEERAALRATMQAGGFTPPDGGRAFGGGGRQGTSPIRPLIQVLAVRAGVATPMPAPAAPTTPSAPAPPY